MTIDNPNSGAARSGQPARFSPLHEARRLLGGKRYREAHALCRAMVEQDPDCADAFYVLGIISYEHGDFERALKLFEVAVQKGHPEPGPHVQAARCFAHLNMPKQALARIDAAKRLNPVDNYTLASIGATLSRLDRHEEAVVFHRKATQASPNDALSFFNLGSSLQFMGDFNGAKEAYRSALRIAPAYTPARVHLTLLTQHTPEHNDLPLLQEAWEKRHPDDAEGGLQLAHAIAKVHEDLADPESVMIWLDRGKALIRQLVPDQQVQDRASFDAAKTLAHALEQDPDTPADGPIFIVGLPRSGTTLVDRIISSHSEIISAGERTEFGACLHRGTGEASRDILDADVISRAAQIDLSAVGERYLESVRAILDGPQRFTDKMPINAFFAPAILAAIPTARVICLRRHPADSVLSIYRQLFAPSATHFRYAYHLESLANHVVAFHQLISTYVETLPKSRFMVIDYENLVENPGAETRRLLTFSGLAFEQACLDFHGNAAPVATASVAQVRQPMYTSSKGRWVRYREQLQPALEILRENGWMGQAD
ncbi:tetratricopeptide repeat-containing sulfotransferase family protein [Hyphomonas johnsonii]|uniref:Sulfotransferase domain-containing protein n=1 Tax=Hyphomonas johnsonii MHS-2 TaxID=1280950 RepID=A0A059FU36_9PROT|nr:sulfotransferase [Hyphomonas johnsonii]KCZ94102.1 sulfotransferase domain-containing protein [Hyphomonas johnsonii MHS-2]